MRAIANNGSGVLVVLCHDETFDELDADIDLVAMGKAPTALKPDNFKGYREVGTGSQILKDLGVSKMRLMSAPIKFNALSGWGLEVTEYLTYEA
jgi:3,4-dihydroxy 2-butanone 4-phosphate synthase/GTP cyclohydrolase II